MGDPDRRACRRSLFSGAAPLPHLRRGLPPGAPPLPAALQLIKTKDAEESRLDDLDLRAGERRRSLAQTGRAGTPKGMHLLAACDGPLIVYAYGTFHICNPTIRQRASRPYCYSATQRLPRLRPLPSPRLEGVLCWE